jgi:hypothetical protein
VLSAGDPRDVVFNLPAGAVGNTVGMPRCSAALAAEANCPRDTIVGLASVFYNFFSFTVEPLLPIFNIAPSPGEPAAFMFTLGGQGVRLDTSLLSDGDYSVSVAARNLLQTLPLLGTYITVWGVPADHQGPGSVTVFGDEVAGGLGFESVLRDRVLWCGSSEREAGAACRLSA